MRIRAFAVATAIVAVFGLAACGTTKDDTPAKPTPSSSPASTAANRTGTFAGLNGKHVAGTVTVSGGKVSLTGFTTDPGPDLHIYLTNGTDEAAVGAGKQLGTISTDGSQTFSLSGIDAGMYTHVVIHCDKAKAVFGAAELS